MILDSTGVREGYCIVWGVGSGRLIGNWLGRAACTSSPSIPTRRKYRQVRRQLIALAFTGSASPSMPASR